MWDVDLLKNETVIRDVLLVAQGEMALEEFLKQVRETWQYYELDLVAYQNKCKLIRGWDELFNKLKENINQVRCMAVTLTLKVHRDLYQPLSLFTDFGHEAVALLPGVRGGGQHVGGEAEPDQQPV